jgi:hypothetical protein
MLRKLEEESPQPLTGSSSGQKATASEALRAAKLLLGCYRTGEANDPETFGAAVAAVLSAYPLDVVRYVCDPRTGLPGSSKWMPNPAEVKAACDEQLAWLAKVERFQNWGKPPADQKRITHEEKPRPTREEMLAKYGPNWGLETIDKPRETRAPAPTIEQLRHHYQHYGLGFAPKDTGDAA